MKTLRALLSGLLLVCGLAQGYVPPNPNGQATMANSTPVVLPSNQSAIPVTQSGAWTVGQSGTWTMQPGNTANTTAWLVTGAGGTFPVTGTFWQATQPVSGPLTDTQLRASAFAVTVASTTITGSVAVTGPLTDTQLRASAVPVSLASVPTHAVTLSSTTITNTVNVVDPDAVGTGSITAADAVVGAPAGTGVLLSGASTAGSYVALACPGGDSAWNVQLTGTFGGTTVYYETSLDSTDGLNGNWIAVNGRQTGVVNTVLGNSTTTAGYFRGNTSGSVWMRVRAVGGAAINVAAKLRISAGTGSVFLNASIPAGTNYIGKTRITDGTLDTTLLNAAPGSDTGQVAVPVRVISSLAGAGGGGPADVGTSTAASESDATRQKVTASLRLLDTAQVAGSQLVAAKGDQTSGLWVNVKNTPAVTLASTTITGTTAVSMATNTPDVTDRAARLLGIVDKGKIWDGTNIAAVKAGVVAVAADNPLVVTIHPSSAPTATQPVSFTQQALPANQSVNVAQMGGIATSMNTGVRDTGTQRVTIATNDLVPISAASLPLPAGASTETTLAAVNTKLPTAAASADGLANPTVTQIGTAPLLFNGTTWDRQRGNFDATTGDTGAKTATFLGATQTNYNARGAVITILLGTVTGTTPTLSAQIQYSYDGGTTFAAFSAANTAVTATGNTIQFMVYPTASNNIATGATQQIITNAALPRKWRVAYTIGGTTPSFTITNVFVNYLL